MCACLSYKKLCGCSEKGDIRAEAYSKYNIARYSFFFCRELYFQDIYDTVYASCTKMVRNDTKHILRRRERIRFIAVRPSGCMDTLTFAGMAALAATAMVIVLVLLVGTERNMRSNVKRGAQRPPAKAQGDVCGICFGTIMNDDVMTKCACSQTFHEACAKPTGKCPYCDRPYTELVTEPPECAVCPSCGSDVVGGVCGCGAVINRDGFTCVCGNKIDANDPVCRKCGKEYEVRSGRRV
jgi:hypothetical protein